MLALVRSARAAEELSPERRDRIRERVLERVEKRWARRRMARAFVTGASALLAGRAAVPRHPETRDAIE